MVPAVTTLHRHLGHQKSSSWGTPAVKRSNRLVILVGVLLAVLAFVGIVVVLNQNAGQPQAGSLLETVLVASQDIAIGDPVTPDVVETREVEPDAVLGQALRDPSQVGGQPALFNIPAGGQVTQGAIGLGAGIEDLSAQLQPGEKAIAFVVDRAQGLNFLVQPGDTIDIIMAVHIESPGGFFVPENGQVVRTVKTVIQNRRVLYVSGTNITPELTPEEEQAQADGQAPVTPAAITNVVIIFAGTDQEAELIRMAQRVEGEFDLGAPATLSVTLRSGQDDAVETTTGITLENLVDTYGVLVPDLEGIFPDVEATVPQ